MSCTFVRCFYSFLKRLSLESCLSLDETYDKYKIVDEQYHFIHNFIQFVLVVVSSQKRKKNGCSDACASIIAR